MSTRTKPKLTSDGQRGAFAAVVTRFDEAHNRVEVRQSLGATPVTAQIAVPAYAPTQGDRVLVLRAEEDLCIVGVLRAHRPLSVTLRDGSSIDVADEVATVRDAGGRVLVRYADGQVQVTAGEGDLVLDAPNGRLVLRAGSDVSVEAAGSILQRARVLVQDAERMEISAERIVSKATDVYHDVAELWQTRAGRMRKLVKDTFALHARRTDMTSEEDTSIDGKRVLLG